MPEVVFTRPDYEPVTHYLFAWSQNLVKFAKSRKWQVTDLAKSRATLTEFTAAVRNNQSELVLLHGHGNYSVITCQDEKILIQAGVNENLLKGTDTYAFSCQTGKELGPAAVKKGAKSYIGYKEDFVYYQTECKEKNPLSDKRAARFLAPALEVSYSLLRGQSPGTAWNNSQKAFKKNIKALISSASKEVYLVRYLAWDLKHQVCITK